MNFLNMILKDRIILILICIQYRFDFVICLMISVCRTLKALKQSFTDSSKTKYFFSKLLMISIEQESISFSAQRFLWFDTDIISLFLWLNYEH